jgi:hypothetical protein
MKLSDIAGDSTLSRISYSDGVAEIYLIDGEIDELLLLRVPTPVFFSTASRAHRRVFIELLPLAEHLPIHSASGRFIAPKSFEFQMKATHRAVHLAYGLRASEFPFLFLVRGECIYFAAPVHSAEHITITNGDVACPGAAANVSGCR